MENGLANDLPEDACPYSGFVPRFSECVDFVPLLAPVRSRSGRAAVDSMSCAHLTVGSADIGFRLYARCKLGGPVRLTPVPG